MFPGVRLARRDQMFQKRSFRIVRMGGLSVLELLPGPFLAGIWIRQHVIDQLQHLPAQSVIVRRRRRKAGPPGPGMSSAPMPAGNEGSSLDIGYSFGPPRHRLSPAPGLGRITDSAERATST